MTGIVSSNKLKHVLVVTVTNTKVHPIYKKRFKERKRFMVATLNNKEYQIGDVVNFVPSRPISKKIRFKISE